MTYRALPAHLIPTAELVGQQFLRGQLGLTGIKIEEPIHKAIEFRPTLSCKRKDHHCVCVEVSESVMPGTIPSFVLQCQQEHFPALVYVAYPTGTQMKDYESQLSRAIACGIGVISVDHVRTVVTVLKGPLSLSLSGLRKIDKASFPAKLREAVSEAETTFRSGNPNKGCSMVYDELESLSRKTAIKACKKGYVTKQPANVSRLDNKMPWASVLQFLLRNIDRGTAKADGKNLDQLSDVMINRLIGITEYRNDSGHKPRSMKKLIERDSRLRTRMEDALDALADLACAVKCLRL